MFHMSPPTSSLSLSPVYPLSSIHSHLLEPMSNALGMRRIFQEFETLFVAYGCLGRITFRYVNILLLHYVHRVETFEVLFVTFNYIS